MPPFCPYRPEFGPHALQVGAQPDRFRRGPDVQDRAIRPVYRRVVRTPRRIFRIPRRDAPDIRFGHGRQSVVRQEDVRVRPERPAHFLTGPQVVPAFHGTGLGIHGRIKPAVIARHLPTQEGEHVFGDGPVGVLSRNIIGEQVYAGEIGLVVQHLLEVGDAPAGIRGVPVKSAADVVVHAAVHHDVQGVGGHGQQGFFARPFVLVQQ